MSITIVELFLSFFFHFSLVRPLGLTKAYLSSLFDPLSHSLFFLLFLFSFLFFFFFGCAFRPNYCVIGLFLFFLLLLLLSNPPLSPRLGWASWCCLALLDLDHVGLLFSVCIFFFFIMLYFGLDWPTLFCHVNRFAWSATRNCTSVTLRFRECFASCFLTIWNIYTLLSEAGYIYIHSVTGNSVEHLQISNNIYIIYLKDLMSLRQYQLSLEWVHD
jgi:hypothetical protein